MGPVSFLLRLSGLPAVSPPRPTADTVAGYERCTRSSVDSAVGADLVPPGPVLPYLLWLGGHRDVLFHGSPRTGLAELRTERESTDPSTFGNQRAVFATDDPVWAIFFAVLVRGSGFGSTRNGSYVSARAPRSRHHYHLSVRRTDDAAPLAPGRLYVLPAATFRRERPWLGLLHTGQWASDRPVRPLASLAVTPADLPVPVGRHETDESLWRVVLAARRLRC